MVRLQLLWTVFQNEPILLGRILLPADYPFKPPHVIFLTKNGRFETNTKICLSISAYHEETWQPAWGIRTMLEAIISFLPSEGNGTIGALDWTPIERKKLAEESLNFVCPTCGRVLDLLQETEDAEDSLQDPSIAEQIRQLTMGKLHSPSQVSTDQEAVPNQSCSSSNTGASPSSSISVPQIDNSPQVLQPPDVKPSEVMRRPDSVPRDWVDDLLWGVLVVVAVLIAILLYRIIARFPSE